ncbi:MAG: hypothetical protein ABI175_10760, partial [Polyangiales bacterium]
MTDRVLPWLKPASWPGWSMCPCRPLLGHSSEDAPWVTYGHMQGDKFEIVTLDSEVGKATTQEDLEKEAIASLESTRPQWKVVQSRKGFLGMRGKPNVIVIEDVDYAAERILDATLMRDGEALLETKLMAVAVPLRGLMMATSAESPDELPSFIKWVDKKHKSAKGATPISSRVFLVRDGVVIGSAQPSAAPESRRAGEGSKRVDLCVSFWQPDVAGTFRAIRNLGILGGQGEDELGPPDRLIVDGVSRDLTPDWLERAVHDTIKSATAVWDEGGHRSLSYFKNNAVKMTINDFALDVDDVLAMLARIPFRVATFATIHPSWKPPGGSERPPPPLLSETMDEAAASVPMVRKSFRFGEDQENLGWAVAFKGDGHKRIVSRRFLEHGPWKMIGGDEDVSLVLFHDLWSDATAAKAQAEVGHARLAEGAVTAPLEMTHELRGFYAEADKRLRVLVEEPGLLDPRRLLEARQAARVGHEIEPGKPIESVAFVFTSEEQARANLHELWVRELECRTSIDKIEKRVDTDYKPADARPDWAR